MCFDAVQEGGGLWFSTVKEPRAELPTHNMEFAAIVCNALKNTLEFL